MDQVLTPPAKAASPKERRAPPPPVERFVFRLPVLSLPQMEPKAPDFTQSQKYDDEAWDPADVPAHEERPKTRGECSDGPRPCPWISCRYNLYLEVTRRGIIQFTRDEIDIDQFPAANSCALDVANRGGMALEKVAAILGLTRERVRQVAMDGLEKVRRSVALREYAREDGFDVAHDIDWAEVSSDASVEEPADDPADPDDDDLALGGP